VTEEHEYATNTEKFVSSYLALWGVHIHKFNKIQFLVSHSAINAPFRVKYGVEELTVVSAGLKVS